MISCKTQKTSSNIKIQLHDNLKLLLNNKDEYEGYILPELATEYLKDKTIVSRKTIKIFQKAGFINSKDNKKRDLKNRLITVFTRSSILSFHSEQIQKCRYMLFKRL